MKCLVSGREKKILVGFEKSIMLAIWTVPRWDVNSLRRKAKTHKKLHRFPGFQSILTLNPSFFTQEIVLGNIRRPPRERM